ncbi:galactose oxidase [Pseudovirgaria hyperparasitica]|uniref:Galactose oxidase n=1 Tax=Pseudovirgaria hyperparasitica TaxID=470096 RepID=A0A6A6VZG4_9PEZI|nr:galactose oxidase [Pseudovirgaria hyperparasitica]KAF2755134.1 galactose oxidase [Pseudovirgaria hyperparasitica]
MLYSIALLCLFLVKSALSLGLVIDRSGWTVSADSSHAGNGPENAIDGNPNTIWHSNYVAGQPDAPLPHRFTIDMQNVYLVNGISYVPRQDSSNNGNIGQHIIEVSNDGSNWNTPVALGTWRNMKDTKYTTFLGRPAGYLRLTAITEAQNVGNQWASIAEINVHRVPDPYLDRSGWRVSADSEETIAHQCQADKATDLDLHTWWHTQYTTRAPAHPHFFTIDQGAATTVSGLSYGPRRIEVEDNSPENGRIGQYRIETSNDNQNWNQVAEGSWPDDYVEKAATFQPVTARYVRLTALSEAGNRGPWTSAGEINLMNGDSLDVYEAPDPTKGLWTHTVDFPLVPAAGGNLYDSGEIMIWSAFSQDQFVGDTHGRTQVAIWNPTNDEMTQEDVANTDHDMFCPGTSLDSTGRIIVTGGNDAPRTSIFDPVSNDWLRGQDMKIPRGYQSQTTLSDGRIFEMGGSWSGNANTHKDGEVYDTTSNTWTRLPGCPTEPMWTQDQGGVVRADNHAWLFAYSNTSILQAGPSKNMHWYNAQGTGSIVDAGTRADDVDSMNGIAVMYDAPRGQILTVGGAVNYEATEAHNNAHLIQINGIDQNPNVQTINPMAFRRGFATGVALPDGSILITGGQSYLNPFTDSFSILTPELWDPRDNSFTTLNPMAIPRTYHSISLLLPDATVLNAGGGLCGSCATNHFDGEIFVPPYLLQANGTARLRPVISSLSASTIPCGAALTISASVPFSTIALMRLSTSTHTVNTDQRRIPFVMSAAATTQTITIPADPGVALPGYYFLFVLDAAGTPSVARTVLITQPEAPRDRQGSVPLETLHTVPQPRPDSNVLDVLGVPDLLSGLPDGIGSLLARLRR